MVDEIGTVDEDLRTSPLQPRETDTGAVALALKIGDNDGERAKKPNLKNEICAPSWG